MRILITAGATREPIDAVRYLSNVSTGKTGAVLAEQLQARGHRITLLHGEGASVPEAVRDCETFSSARDLQQRLRDRLATGRYDVVIMAAAVADYRPSRASSGKLSSDSERRTVVLLRNPKLLPRLKSYAPKAPLVIGFKLTVGATAAAQRRAISRQFAAGGVDAVVHNDLGEIVRRVTHPYQIWTSPQTSLPVVRGSARLATALDRFLAAAQTQIGTRATPRRR